MADKLQAANEALIKANSAYQDARARCDSVRRDETKAINDLNAAQKAFDAVVAEMRKDAPRDSDWKRPTGVLA